MICKTCGKEFEDDNTFCPYCGEKVEVYDSEQLENTDEAATRDNVGAKRPKKVKIIIIIAAIIIILAGVAGYFVYKSVSKPTTIDLTSVMTTPEFEGIDGKGELKKDAVVDSDKADQLIQSIDNDTRAKAVRSLLQGTTYTADKMDSLSNGDEVVITAHYDASFAEENKIEIKGTKKTVKVKNLDTIITVEDIKKNGIIDQLKKDEYFNLLDGTIYKWLYCKTSKGNMIAVISYIDDFDEYGDSMRYWTIGITSFFTTSLDGIRMTTDDAFTTGLLGSYDECIDRIRAEGFTVEVIQ